MKKLIDRIVNLPLQLIEKKSKFLIIVLTIGLFVFLIKGLFEASSFYHFGMLFIGFLVFWLMCAIIRSGDLDI